MGKEGDEGKALGVEIRSCAICHERNRERPAGQRNVRMHGPMSVRENAKWDSSHLSSTVSTVTGSDAGGFQGWHFPMNGLRQVRLARIRNVLARIKRNMRPKPMLCTVKVPSSTPISLHETCFTTV